MQDTHAPMPDDIAPDAADPAAGDAGPGLAATWRDGALWPDAPLDLAEGTRVRVAVVADDGVAVRTLPEASASRAGLMAAGLAARSRVLSARWSGADGVERLGWILFFLSLAVYAFTRLWALDRFPIYFFADEAFHPIHATELVERGFKDGAGRWFPMYFEAAARRWTPVFSLYVHLLPTLLFGKTVFVTRATTAVVSLLGAGAVALMLKQAFGARYWWTGVLALGLMPAWLLHSRTGFETAMMASFYAGCLWCYLRYRTDSPRFIYGALVFGAMTFYAYSNGQAVMGVTALGLLVIDLPYHWRQRRVLLPALLLGAVLAWPFVDFRLHNTGAVAEHLRMIGSYVYDPDLGPAQKVAAFARRYAWGLSPQYWVLSADHYGQWRDLMLKASPDLQSWLAPTIALDIVRHRYKDLGHIPWFLAPFLVLGLGICLRYFTSVTHRVILIAALAAPVGAALAEVGITRVLAFLVPAAVMTGLGLNWVLVRVERRTGPVLAAGGAFAALASASVLLIVNAVGGGGGWYSDYGLYGMQWGARQLFGEVVPELLDADPDLRLNVSSEWANAADTFPRFFLAPEQRARVQFGGYGELTLRQKDIAPHTLWVLTPAELQQAKDSGKFQYISPERVIVYPDGSPAFYFTRLAYAADAAERYAAERERRKELVSEVTEIGGQQVKVRRSRSDMGRAFDMFDGDLFSLMRGQEANPLVVELEFPTPRPVKALAGDFSTMGFTWTIDLYPAGGGEPVTYQRAYPNSGAPNVHEEIAFDRGPDEVAKMRIAIHNDDLADDAIVNIHVRELTLR